MSIPLQCNCGAKLKAPDDRIGKRVRCSKCRAIIEVKAPDTVPTYEANCPQCDQLHTLGVTDLGERLKCAACGAAFRFDGDKKQARTHPILWVAAVLCIAVAGWVVTQHFMHLGSAPETAMALAQAEAVPPQAGIAVLTEQTLATAPAGTSPSQNEPEDYVSVKTQTPVKPAGLGRSRADIKREWDESRGWYASWSRHTDNTVCYAAKNKDYPRLTYTISGPPSDVTGVTLRMLVDGINSDQDMTLNLVMVGMVLSSVSTWDHLEIAHWIGFLCPSVDDWPDGGRKLQRGREQLWINTAVTVEGPTLMVGVRMVEESAWADSFLPKPAGLGWSLARVQHEWGERQGWYTLLSKETDGVSRYMAGNKNLPRIVYNVIGPPADISSLTLYIEVKTGDARDVLVENLVGPSRMFSKLTTWNENTIAGWVGSLFVSLLHRPTEWPNAGYKLHRGYDMLWMNSIDTTDGSLLMVGVQVAEKPEWSDWSAPAFESVPSFVFSRVSSQPEAFGGFEVTGKITNKSGRHLQTSPFFLTVYNPHGHSISTAHINITNFGRGQTKSFTAHVETAPKGSQFKIVYNPANE